MNVSLRVLLALTCFASVFPVSAAMISSEGLQACRHVANDQARLACYDALSEKEPKAAQTAPAPGDTAWNRASEEEQTVVPGERQNAAPESRLARAWDLEPGKRGDLLSLRPYQPVYLLPWFHSTDVNRSPSSPSDGRTTTRPMDVDANEAKLQISLKTRVAEDLIGDNGDLWFGYTQSSRWQVYNGGQSRPFRETNYEPELMFVWRTDYDVLGWRGRLLNLGINHQSNGRSLPLSRGWNRLMLSTSLERENWTMTLRPWWRLPDRSSRDDNPDISDYIGRADLHLVRTEGKHQFSALFRHTLRGGDKNRGAVQLDYAFPIAGELRGHIQWFSGYGESLIDYNHRANYIGVGLSLLEWY